MSWALRLRNEQIRNRAAAKRDTPTKARLCHGWIYICKPKFMEERSPPVLRNIGWGQGLLCPKAVPWSACL
eukprot:2637689-Amphidinium_carterae.1